MSADAGSAGSEETTDPEILKDLELDLEWKVWEKWIGSVPQIHKSGSVPMSDRAMLYLIH